MTALVLVAAFVSLPSVASATATRRGVPTKHPSLAAIPDPRIPGVTPLRRPGMRAVSLAPSTPHQGSPGGAALPQPSLIHRVPGPTLAAGPGPGPRPHSASQIGPIYSTNWSGQVLTGDLFTGVGGHWVVPTVQPSTAPEYSSTWIGIDGLTASSLIQTGTEQDSISGTTTYSAWVELLGQGPSMTITNAPVSAGDAMQATVVESSLNMWTVSILDTTANWTFSQTFSYTTPGFSAEWIEEAPTVNQSQSTLANFGVATFNTMGAQAAGLASSVLIPLYMLTPDGSAIIAYPGAFDSATNSFSDFFGSPPPVVTSISPAQGLIGGGDFVTIQGDFLLGAETVSFGGIATLFTVNADLSITAIAPQEGPGTVDILVTTPGGTSAPSIADEFTYLVPAPPPPSSSPGSPHGYWLVGGDGGIFTFGSAQFYGSTGNLRLQRPVVGITPTVDESGYWLVASDGGIFAFGDAGFYGSIPGLGYAPAGTVGASHPLNAPVVGMVPTTDGGGYFMVASDGGVFTFGDARFAGSCPGIGGCAGAAVAVMPDASGNGYWVVTATGNVYSFGDATYFGGPGNQGSLVTSAVRTPDGQGYWILFANGTVAGFGDAADLGGPSAAVGGADPAAAIFTTADGGGYWVTSATGAVYTYGDAPYDGGMGSVRLNAPIIAATGW